jgi:cytoskeleton protein RodZ
MTMKNENAERPRTGLMEPYPDLKALRESHGRTLKDISQKTRIRVAYLEAIESGRFKSLPERTYAESFIRTYGRELGIDSGTILSHYRKYLRDQTGVPEDKVEKIQQKTSRSAEAPVDRSRWLREHLAVFRWMGAHLKVLGWTAAVLVVAGAIFFFIFADDDTDSDLSRAPAAVSIAKNAPAETSEKPAEPAREEGKEGVPATAPVPPTQPEAKPEALPLRLVITATQTTWVRIAGDDNPSYQILMKPGDTLERQAEKVFAVDVGNAGGIDIQFQGKSLGSLGKSGEVVHLTLPEGARR